jgi:hypothetical protein
VLPKERKKTIRYREGDSYSQCTALDLLLHGTQNDSHGFVDLFFTKP